MLKKSVFSIFKDWWTQTSFATKLIIIIFLTSVITSLTYYFVYPFQNAKIAEITAIPATPPFQNNPLYLGATNVTVSASSLNFYVNDQNVRSFNFMFYPSFINSSNGHAYSPTEYLSAYWYEAGATMSVYLGFETTDLSSWRLTQISTSDSYTGTNTWQPADPNTNDLFGYHPIGNAINLENVSLVSTNNPSLKMTLSNLHLIAFNNFIVPTPSPSLSPAPSLFPSPIPSPSSTEICSLNPADFMVTPTTTQAYPGQSVQYTLHITNRDGRVCGSSSFAVSLNLPQHLSAGPTNPLLLAPGESGAISVTISTPLFNPWAEARTMPLTFTINNQRSNLSTSRTTPFTLLNPAPQTFNLNLRLAGVPNDRAEGATANIKFSVKDQGSFTLSEPVTLSHLYNDVYRATFSLGTPLAPNTNYTLRIKGEKHVGLKQCANPINLGPCPDNQYLSIPYYAGSPVDLDLTNSPLPPGDLKPQDGQVNYQDITKLKTLMGKAQNSLTPDDLYVGDLNYDGYINTYDVFLLLKTMEIRYDE